MYCIAGADGFLGAYIQKELISCGESIIALNHRQPLFTDKLVTNLNISIEDKSSLNAAEALLKKQKDIKLIYLIAAHNPDFVRKNPQQAKNINLNALNSFAQKLSLCNVSSFYYASSDTVYGESKNGKIFTENDSPSPINVYGEQKAEAELIAAKYGFSCVRFSYMFAPSICKKQHFFDSIVALLKNGKEVQMFTDYIRSALTYKAAANCLIKLINTPTQNKIFNICAPNTVSKYDIGIMAANYSGTSKSLVVPVKSSDTDVFTEKRANTIQMSPDLLFSTVLGTKDTDFYSLRG